MSEPLQLVTVNYIDEFHKYNDHRKGKKKKHKNKYCMIQFI